MERITYRKTLDVHKNGIQFMLQGFETADKMSRVIEISLMASGDAIDFPLESITAVMYVTTPSATGPSITECTIKDNKVVYDVLPIVEEGITTMQLKLIETSPDGAASVLVSPKFAIEVSKSDTDEEEAEQAVTYTAIENAIAMAKEAYGKRLERIELDSECIFKAYYADGTTYETDVLQKLFMNGNVLLSESFAHGGTGIRAGEDTDNSMYYSNVSKSESLNAKAIMENSEEILEEVKLHGVYTAFEMDFETGELVYLSPKYKFKLNTETGELEAEGRAFAPEDVLLTIVIDWLESIGITLPDDFNTLKEKVDEHSETLEEHSSKLEELTTRVTPVEKGGTGATTAADALAKLGGARIITGSYVGNGSRTEYNTDHFQVIDLGETPKAVIVARGGVLEGQSYNSTYEQITSCMAVLGIEGNNALQICENGFMVNTNNINSYENGVFLNTDGAIYLYIAFF